MLLSIEFFHLLIINCRIAPEGVDVVLDCMAGDDCERGLALLKFNGKYIMYGTSSLLSWDVKNLFGFTKGMSTVCKTKESKQKSHGSS